MNRTVKGGVLAVGAVLVVAGVFVLAGGKPAPNVQLRADFMPFTDLGAPCVILNDSKGPYVTDGRHNVSVWFTSDVGDLFFKFEHHAERSMIIKFPNVYSECGGWLPDSGFIDERPDEPIDFFRFTTHNNDAYAPPKVNFLTMTPGVPTLTRLWTTFCTTQRHYYFMNYDLAAGGKISGTVEVTAFDDNGDGKLDRWVFVPVTGTGDAADIFKHPETGDDSINCPFGTFPMPFKLVLYRR